MDKYELTIESSLSKKRSVLYEVLPLGNILYVVGIYRRFM